MNRIDAALRAGYLLLSGNELYGGKPRLTVDAYRRACWREKRPCFVLRSGPRMMRGSIDLDPANRKPSRYQAERIFELLFDYGVDRLAGMGSGDGPIMTFYRLQAGRAEAFARAVLSILNGPERCPEGAPCPTFLEFLERRAAWQPGTRRFLARLEKQNLLGALPLRAGPQMRGVLVELLRRAGGFPGLWHIVENYRVLYDPQFEGTWGLPGNPIGGGNT